MIFKISFKYRYRIFFYHITQYFEAIFTHFYLFLPLKKLNFWKYHLRKNSSFEINRDPSSHVETFFLQYSPRLRVRLQELQTGAESQDSQSMQQVAAMESDIEIQCIPADI